MSEAQTPPTNTPPAAPPPAATPSAAGAKPEAGEKAPRISLKGAPSPTETAKSTPPAADPAAQTTAGEGTKEKTAPKPKIAPKVADLAAREAAIKKSEADIAARAKAVEERESVFSKDSALKSPLKVLEKMGLSFQEFADAIISEGKPAEKDAATEALERVNSLADEIAEDKRKAQEKQDAEQQGYIDKAITDAQARIKSYVHDNPDSCEMIIALEAEHLPWEIIQEDFNRSFAKDPEKAAPMSHQRACEIAENFLVHRTKKALGAKKMKALFGPKEKDKTPETLSADMSTAGNGSGVQERVLSKQERFDRAKALLKFDA